MEGQVLDGSIEIAWREGGETKKETISSLFKGKRSVLFAVPGAFTPTCSEKHLPGFIAQSDEFKQSGVDLIVCLSVNDPFVMAAWAEQQGAGDKVKLVADGNGTFSKSVGQLSDKTAHNMGMRSERYAIVIDSDLKVEYFAKGDGSFAGPVLEFLRSSKK
ncbi:hypothetical protein GUITHDRAFT_89112 [Guillardia theta CCMP2712]|uniref:Thioredoxin domain-containing protein n=2 Tax=Guillardia theta TaxID=55529 RepID=L1ISU7_GUITC|nr:hypothetical protein GUITHDRAFT_89112 [Guillardia theta CCMP2712]EKX39321.1 hypothetical protein GUITHDRAFT_89112 [Guillardia theta CCMP2712]|eukprot:XP_005826301.1 hypothetical protein GUITHDRAFT_89112 [Guillardia theta CCMP2712]